MEDGIAILFGASLLAAFVFAVILPDLFENRRNKLLCTMASVAVFFAYWQDLIFYPLSDFYAFALLLCAVYCMVKAEDWKERIGWYVLPLYVICGICLYGAYNTRTIYLFAGPFIVMLFLFFNRKEAKKRLILYLCCIMAGVLSCGIPQARINQKHHNSFSIAVDTSSMEGGSLFNFQLTSGITVQRYETYVGPEDGYPKHKFIFEDEAGKRIMEAEGKVLLESIGEYVGDVLKYPLDFIGIYTRHLLNAFCLPYNHAYVKWLHAYKPWLILANYTLVFIAGMAIILQKSWKLSLLKRNNIYMLATLIPCVMILPGAIEMRYFVQMYILMYGYLVYAADYGLLLNYTKKHMVKVLAAYIGILCVCLSVWGSTMASAECGAQLLFR